MVAKQPTEVKSVTLGDVKAADAAIGIKSVESSASKGDKRLEKLEKSADKNADKMIKKNTKKLEKLAPSTPSPTPR
jgi:hypothetical protein